MDWIPQIDAYFSHVVSQWTYQWLSLPEFSSKHIQRVDCSTITLAFLQEYLSSRWDLNKPIMPWMLRLRHKDLSCSAVVSLVYEQVTRAMENSAYLLDFYHADYPPLLRCIADPPNVLTAKGNAGLLYKKSLAIIGSRKSSGFALQETERLAKSLALDGHVIVSGGALGCDMASHLGALRSNVLPAPTIVVFAGGLSKLYPACHQYYFDQLLEAGAVFLSERLWSYPARPFDFPVRNRIISGLALRLLVMQAGERSGAKLTANLAVEQGREVFVLVHEENDVRARGSHSLLDEGAVPFHSADDYLSLPYLL